MPLQECGLNLNHEQLELKPHGDLLFPCAGYASDLTPVTTIPWHWHEDLELVQVTAGQLTLSLPDSTLDLTANDLVIINSNVLHTLTTPTAASLHSVVFSPLLITGTRESVFAKKYLDPLISDNVFSGIKLSDMEQSYTDWFTQAFSALATDPTGFEFIVRHTLSQIVLALDHTFKTQFHSHQSKRLADDRIHQMLTYVHKHYCDPLTVAMIAQAANVSERECLRTFQHEIKLSPIQYLLKYRVMRGAEVLLTQPETAVSQIAMNSGFDSPSHFTKLFRRYYKQTPSMFRHQQTTK